jgi:hypothetical protein
MMMQSRIVSSAALTRSEGIDDVSFDSRSDVSVQSPKAYDIDLASKSTLEQHADVPLKPNIGEEVHAGVAIDVDQDIDVAIGTVLVARYGTEQPSVSHAPKRQLRL